MEITVKKLLVNKICLIFIILTTFSIDLLAKKAAIVVDFETSEVLFEKKRRYEKLPCVTY